MRIWRCRNIWRDHIIIVTKSKHDGWNRFGVLGYRRFNERRSQSTPALQRPLSNASRTKTTVRAAAELSQVGRGVNASKDAKHLTYEESFTPKNTCCPSMLRINYGTLHFHFLLSIQTFGYERLQCWIGCVGQNYPVHISSAHHIDTAVPSIFDYSSYRTHAK